MRSGALAAPTKINAVLGTTTAAVLLCYLVFRSASTAKLKRRNDNSRDDAHSPACEGLVDLIRDQDGCYADERQLLDEPLPGMTREELARGRLVVVVCGPSSTKVYQVRE